MTVPILTVIGKSGSGKTTLLEKIIPELKRRGYHVATIKHHSHSGFEIDIPGKDTWRHACAGSDHVIIAGPDRLASIRRLERELTLDEIAEEIIAPDRISPGNPQVDIILTEGFKRANKPALEVARAENGLELISNLEQLVLIATDTPLDVDAPQFDLNSVDQIVDFIEDYFSMNRSQHSMRLPE